MSSALTAFAVAALLALPGLARAQGSGFDGGLQQGATLGTPPAVAEPDEGPRLLTVTLGAFAGMTFDARTCTLAGQDSPTPETRPCVLFSAGADLGLLWRGRLGGAFGLYSVSGQAARAGQDAGIPDRISLPLAIEVRPLAFLPQASRAPRVLSGVGLRLGPSLEIVRTASDLHAGAGATFAAFGEVPLTSSARQGLALRLALHVLAAPRVSLNDGVVRSAPFEVCPPQNPEPGCTPADQRTSGYGAVVQTYLGLVYYP